MDTGVIGPVTDMRDFKASFGGSQNATTGPQLLITAGIMTGYFTCYGSSGIKSSLSWRTPFILLASLSILLCASTFFFLPPSPRWLTLHGRRQEAEEAWNKLDISHAEREKAELETEGVEVAAPTDKSHARETITEPTEKPKPSVMDKLFDIFSKDARSRTAFVVFMMGMQQLSGIDGVLYVCSHSLLLFPVF